MSIQEIAGQQTAKHMLQQSLRQQVVSHAYLFHGPAGTGKVRMASSFAKAMFCLEQADDACNQCIECRKFNHGNHPNIIYIQPEGQTIKLEQIKSLQHELSYRAVSEQVRIYIIEQAERLTTEAANRLLKFLEEPHLNIIAILTTDNGQAILPTIQSRVQHIPFFPMSPDAMLNILLADGEPELLARPAVHLATGLESARVFIQLKWFAEIRNVMIQCAKAVENSYASASIIAQQLVIKSDLLEHMSTLFDLFVLWYKDMVHIHSGRNDRIVFIDETDWLMKHSLSRHVNDWINGMEYAVLAQKRLRANAHPQLTLEWYLSQVKGE